MYVYLISDIPYFILRKENVHAIAIEYYKVPIT